MQVNKISNNAASFGMALKITPAAREALQKTTMETIEKLQKAGEELKDTKFYHLEIGKNISPRIDSKYAASYVAPFKVQKPRDEFLNIETIWDGTEVYDFKRGMKHTAAIKFENKAAAMEAYGKLKNMTSDFDKAVELTKLFDKRAIQRETRELAEKEREQKIIAAANKLMEQFGAEPHVKP